MRNESAAIIEGFAWGTEVSGLLYVSYSASCYIGLTAKRRQHAPGGFDALFLSDLLHFDSSHDELLSSTTSLLKRSAEARVYVCSGDYTKPAVCAAFVANAERHGLLMEEQPREDTWLASRSQRGAEKEDMDSRKRQCRFWMGKWKD